MSLRIGIRTFYFVFRKHIDVFPKITGAKYDEQNISVDRSQLLNLREFKEAFANSSIIQSHPHTYHRSCSIEK